MRFSEDILYLMTLLAAPWLLRQGQHIRVDIILRALPVRVAWLLEWLGDIVGLLCCLYFVWYGLLITTASYNAGSINIKTLVTPEWWTLAPLPLGFALLAIEFIFRMHRLASSPKSACATTPFRRPESWTPPCPGKWPRCCFSAARRSCCLPGCRSRSRSSRST